MMGPEDAAKLSPQLAVGAVYTRANLKQMLNTSDATINNGVFKPAGFGSVLIFVTKNKTSDRTQYVDHLEGDTLYWQGQTSGRTDALVADHRPRKLELLVFYRDDKNEHPHAGFRYLGRFIYKSHVAGQRPTDFVLTREHAADE